MQRRSRGVTLIELLIMMLIICVLASFLFSFLGRIRDKGRATICQSNVKQILTAFQLYAQDHDNHLPFGAVAPNARSNRWRTWHDVLVTYIKSQQVFTCPTDHSQSVVGNPDGPAFHVSYSANHAIIKVGKGLQVMLGMAGSRSVMLPITRGQVVKPATTVLLSDGCVKTESQAPWVTPFSEERQNCWFISHPVQSAPEQSYPSHYIGGPSLRHSGMSMVGFVDGHVKVMKPETWYYPDTPWLDWTKGGKE